jgi:hypothetical protein
LQIQKMPWRHTLAGCRVTVYEHLDGTLSVGYGPHTVGRFTAEGLPWPEPLSNRRGPAVEKPLQGKVSKQTFPLRLEIPPKARDSHFPTAPATTGD